MTKKKRFPVKIIVIKISFHLVYFIQKILIWEMSAQKETSFNKYLIKTL